MAQAVLVEVAAGGLVLAGRTVCEVDDGIWGVARDVFGRAHNQGDPDVDDA
ncbi:hypothetical protein OHA84_35900 [Streptomyces sp. NBC_00513]|uniref:hypothetical protein n=1 Tax=unclassified Streptomyces TaxID=2593676 RepID=UPI00225B1ECC|nr:hypothetical protein [Streptomyces sp. NBC_00424]MCX5071111.1 hypothetical protein [Streptomyces sp. NBC_00424]WUD45466.1 hypothetical protein OHA84_35900 [Streptomyces sp. NBC_00513]